MSWNRWSTQDLGGLFFDLEIEEAYKNGNLHNVGKLLRFYKNSGYPPQDEEENDRDYTNYEKSILRNMTRRTP